VRWLLNHRTPTGLVLARQLDEDPSGPYLAVLTGLAERLGYLEATRKLPSLLGKARNDADRLVVLHTLANVRTAEAVQTLLVFLRTAKKGTPEALICEAARGLGETRDERNVPALRVCLPFVSTPLGKAQLATALLQCGDETALAGLLAPLREPEPDDALCRYVLGVLPDFRSTEALGELAKFAIEADDPALAEAGYVALQRATGAMDPMASATHEPEEGQGQPAGPPVAGTEGQENEAKPLDWGGASRDERQDVVQSLLEQWRARGTPRAPESLTSQMPDM
jgi:hypothetical protein